MPSFVPRLEPTKKGEELAYRKGILENAIKNNLDQNIILKKAAKFKQTKILYLKAILHVIREKEWMCIKHSYNKIEIQENLTNLEIKSLEEVIIDFKKEFNINSM